MSDMVPEIDKLRKMLDKAGIPYENRVEYIEDDVDTYVKLYGEAGKYRWNQVIYGLSTLPQGYTFPWKFDAIWQRGSCGAMAGLIEAYGPLGRDKEGLPREMTAQEAFDIIKADYEKERGKEDKTHGGT